VTEPQRKREFRPAADPAGIAIGMLAALKVSSREDPGHRKRRDLLALP
jgi:hypothetical protein